MLDRNLARRHNGSTFEIPPAKALAMKRTILKAMGSEQLGSMAARYKQTPSLTPYTHWASMRYLTTGSSRSDIIKIYPRIASSKGSDRDPGKVVREQSRYEQNTAKRTKSK